MGSYIPSTIEERRQMLESLGCKSFEELYQALPKDVLLKGDIDVPNGISELEVRAKMEAIAAKNKVFKTVFRGAGAYKHYIPSIVKYITAKEEFVTAYTPYQAELSQGVLQSIFEYQTNVCELLGMDATNASVYDGATAAAEAVAMCRERKRTKTLISAAAYPDTINTVATYCHAANCEMEVVPVKDGVTDVEALKAMLKEDVACVFIQQVNYFGQLEDCEALANIIHEAGAKFIMGCNPISMGILKTPGECGADIATAEGQPLGMSLSFGGPYLGIMACTEKMQRKLPGRIAGQTVDAAGERVYVLTLQAREQHIRREKSSSNICSNQALCAMTASVYLGTVGPEGIKQAAQLNLSKSHYAKDQICKIKGFEAKFGGEFFNEFVTKCPVDPEKLMAKLEEHNILGGLPLDGDNKGCILWCVTETNTKEEIDTLVAILKEVAAA